jgi:Trk K+ transport system NAD-binding subunit
LSSPLKFLVKDWLISVPGTTLRELTSPPSGRWIVCGVGRFGRRVVEQLEKNHLPVTVLDAHADRLAGFRNTLPGRGTEAQALEAAGIADAVGIVAATNNDIDNLSIIMTARNLNPGLFVIARQDRIQNTGLFDRSGVDLVALRSRIVARQILSIVTTPLLQAFLQHLIRSDESFAERIATRLKNVLDNRAPNIWVIELTGEIAKNLRFVRSLNQKIRLEHITRNSRSEENEYLACVCLSMERGAQRIFLPDNKTELQIDDRLLFAGRDLARRRMLWTLMDSHSLLVNASGKHLPRGALWRWLFNR